MHRRRLLLTPPPRWRAPRRLSRWSPRSSPQRRTTRKVASCCCVAPPPCGARQTERCARAMLTTIRRRTYPGKWHGISGGIEAATGSLAETPLERALVEIQVSWFHVAPPLVGCAERTSRAGRNVHPASLAAPGVSRPPAARGRRRAFIPGAPAAVLNHGGLAASDAELGKRRGALGAARRGGRLRRGAVAGARQLW